MTSELQTALEVQIRDIREDDVPTIAEIDARARRRQRAQSWAERLYSLSAKQAGAGARQWCRVAEVEGQVVGFLLGQVRADEFELPPCGWIVTIGVDPEFQGRHVGRQLVQQFIDDLVARKVTTVRTMVAWDNAELLSFFGSLSFDCGPLLPLERQLKPPDVHILAGQGSDHTQKETKKEEP